MTSPKREDTPRTDDFLTGAILTVTDSSGRKWSYEGLADFARTLERELAEAQRLEFYWLEQCKLGAGGLAKLASAEAKLAERDALLTEALDKWDAWMCVGSADANDWRVDTARIAEIHAKLKEKS